MPNPSNPSNPPNPIEALSGVIAGVDYGLEHDNFVFYELGRLIEEDRASFEDQEFRRLIDEGVRQHVEERPSVRAHLAGLFRRALPGMKSEAGVIAKRVIRALEDIDSDLRNVGVVVGSYTAYLFERLETLEQGDERVALTADLIFESPEDRSAVESAIDVLAGIRSSVSARVLAHAISEPMLEEALEDKAYQALKGLWPLSRDYMLYTLHSHTHMDLPFRWFQLFMESNDIAGGDLVLAECRLHGNNAAFREDLAAVIELLLNSRDPETEEKVVDLLNDAETARPVAEMLQIFLKAYRRPASPGAAAADPWARREQLREINGRYLAAAALYDSGKRTEAADALQAILAAEPGYPFASNLREIIRSLDL